MLHAFAVVPDHGLGGFEQPGRGAVGGVEVDPAGVGEVLLEVEDVAQLCAAPSVDGLVGVTDDEHVALVLCYEAREHVLGPVGVLALVDQDVPVPPGGCLPRVGLVVERPDGPEQHVVEVEAVGRSKHSLIGVGEFGVPVAVFVAFPGFRVCRVFHDVLENAHALDERLWLPHADVDAGVEHALAHDVDLLGLVRDSKVGADSAGRAVLAQEASTEPVERRYPDAAR